METVRSYNKYTRDVLAPLVAQSTSVSGVVRLLGLREAGGTHTHLSRTIKRFGLDTSHFGRFPPGARRIRLLPDQILLRQASGSRRQKPLLLRRALLESGVPYRCASCDNDGTWLGKSLTLDVDHIDGDYHNNEIGNLRFLCPNCHRQTPNFAGRSHGQRVDDATRVNIRRVSDG